MTIGSIRSMAQRVAAWWLMAWVAFFVLNTLQPCCEAIAGAIPHDHAMQTLRQAGVGDHGASANATVPQPSSHHHCGKAQTILAEEPMAIASVSDSAATASACSPLDDLLRLGLARDSAPHAIAHPLPSPRLYLDTLRLRI